MNDLTMRIAEQIAEIFPDSTIYTENQSSGFDVPSFYIARNTTEVLPQLVNVQRRLYGYQVIYFADSNEELEEVSEKLLNNFVDIKEYANIQDKTLTQDTNEKTVILSFDVFIRAWKKNNDPVQERIDLDVRRKENDN